MCPVEAELNKSMFCLLFWVIRGERQDLAFILEDKHHGLQCLETDKLGNWQVVQSLRFSVVSVEM